jgi:hypothetical protein
VARKLKAADVIDVLSGYNGTLGTGFGQRIHVANDPPAPIAIAA